MCLAPGNELFGSTVKVRRNTGPKEKCGDIGSGTSWSTPVTAGAVSMLLEANANLTWRDVQHIIARSSYRQLANDWVTNSAGRKFSYNSGFGNLDIANALKLASNWVSFPQERSTTGQNQTRVSVGNSAVNYFIDINTDLVVESVNVEMDISVQARGGLEIDLISPSGTLHHIFKARPDYEPNYVDWPTLARGFWDERSRGRWAVRVTKNNKHTTAGSTTINGMVLTVYGTNPNEYPKNAPEIQVEVPAPHLKGEVARGSVTVQFQQENNLKVNHNELQIRSIDSDWKSYGTTTSTSITVRNLKAGSIYMFKGRAQLGSKWSEYSQVLTVTAK